MKQIIHIISIFLTFSLLSLCSREQSELVVPQLIKFEKNQTQLVSADNKLGFTIYKNVLNSDNSNILISPINLNKSLSILLYSTKNNFKIRRILQINKIKKESVYNNINKLNNTIYNIDKNSLFQNSTNLLLNEQNIIKNEFKHFVNKNKINYLYSDKIEQSNSFNIDNNISLKCNFKYQTGNTESPFYLNPNMSKFVEMHVCESDFNFYTDDIIKAIEMPIGRGNFNALIILPESNQSIQSIKSKINRYYIERINKKFRKINLSVKVPKLNIKYSYSFKEQGLRNYFSENTQKYKQICNDKELFLNNITQSVKIETVSKTINTRTLFDTKSKNNFFVDRPFLLIITEKYSGSILFMGEITNPEF